MNSFKFSRLVPIALVFISALGLFLSLQAGASVALLEKDQWKISLGGFVETDFISDSSRSFAETIGNTPVVRGDTVGRTQLSIRNSRLSFAIEAPPVEDWKSKGYFEFDLLGFDPAPGATNTEFSYFSSPTFRARHGYLQMEKNGWLLLAGQTWMLLGWQPYYFLPTAEVAPIPAMLYNRTPQFRVQKTMNLENQTDLQAALGVMRPPQRDSNLPGFEGGLRLVVGSRTSGFVGGASSPQKTQPMSLGVSGAFREIVIPTNIADTTSPQAHFPGHALALNALLPIVASSDGKDVGHTLTLGGEFTTGTGYGDQLNGWTGNQASPLNSAAAGSEKNVNLDAGIGGFNSTTGAFSLVNLQSFNAHLQYHLSAESRTWLSAGYGELKSNNIGSMNPAAGKVAYDKERVYFGNIMHDCTSQIRWGFEYSYTRTHYTDGAWAHNSRYQITALFLF